MQHEFLFYADKNMDLKLDASIHVTKNQDEQAIISNANNNCDIYAPEINFYLKNSKDIGEEKATNIKALYDVRSKIYDGALDFDYSQDVDNKVLIISQSDESELQAKLKNEGFTCSSINPASIIDISGHIGALHVKIKNKDEILNLQTSQILWDTPTKMATKQSGTIDTNDLQTEQIIAKLKENLGVYKYKNYIKYDVNICQYKGRHVSETCGNCADVCPTVAIRKDESKKELKFSYIDCHGCGGCVSICPSGAMEYTQMPRASLIDVYKIYEDKSMLIIPRKMELSTLHVELPSGVLPFAIEGEKYLHEAHFMSFLQNTGKSIVFYTDFLSKGSKDAILIINKIWQKKFGKIAIHVAMNEDELKDALLHVDDFDCKYHFDESNMNKREVFSARLAHLIGDEDLGEISTGEHVQYGNIEIKQSKCTLCLACAGACNVKALSAHASDNSLRYNASICTNCGYCASVCPEDNCLTLISGKISLNKEYFSTRVMAKDTLAACVECGKEFATQKAIDKIASVMKPLFLGDELKTKTLYACADCKPKMLLKSELEKRVQEKNGAKKGNINFN